MWSAGRTGVAQLVARSPTPDRCVVGLSPTCGLRISRLEPVLPGWGNNSSLWLGLLPLGLWALSLRGLQQYSFVLLCTLKGNTRQNSCSSLYSTAPQSHCYWHCCSWPCCHCLFWGSEGPNQCPLAFRECTVVGVLVLWGVPSPLAVVGPGAASFWPGPRLTKLLVNNQLVTYLADNQRPEAWLNQGYFNRYLVTS